MSYFISRNNQQYGPYTLDDLQTHIASGNVSLADQVRDDEGGPWATVGALLNHTSQVSAPAAAAGPTLSGIDLPPNLHWAIVLLIGFVFNPFVLGWHIYQIIWIRKIDKESKALLYFGLAFGGFTVFFVIGLVMLLHDNSNPNPWGALPLTLGGLSLIVFSIMSMFDMRRSMVEYYNTIEPINLRLSGIMTFFFNIYYFQHHMSRIATWKTTGYLAPQG